MIMIIQAFVLKLIDNGLATIKTIYLHKEKYFLGAVFNSLSTFFYLIAIVQIAKSNDIFSIIAMCLATFLGTYFPGIIIKKSERNKLFIFDVTADNLESGKEFADKIRDKNIAIKSYITYNEDLEKVLSCKIYSNNRDESKTINKLIPQNFKYNVYVPLNND